MLTPRMIIRKLSGMRSRTAPENQYHCGSVSANRRATIPPWFPPLKQNDHSPFSFFTSSRSWYFGLVSSAVRNSCICCFVLPGTMHITRDVTPMPTFPCFRLMPVSASTQSGSISLTRYFSGAVLQAQQIQIQFRTVNEV